MQRRRYLFSGHVQGVGFRYTTREIARGYDVRGFVRNLADGKVELVLEGDGQQINQLLDELTRKMEGFIHHTDRADAPPTGEFADFRVR